MWSGGNSRGGYQGNNSRSGGNRGGGGYNSGYYSNSNSGNYNSGYYSSSNNNSGYYNSSNNNNNSGYYNNNYSSYNNRDNRGGSGGGGGGGYNRRDQTPHPLFIAGTDARKRVVSVNLFDIVPADKVGTQFIQTWWCYDVDLKKANPKDDQDLLLEPNGRWQTMGKILTEENIDTFFDGIKPVYDGDKRIYMPKVIEEHHLRKLNATYDVHKDKLRVNVVLSRVPCKLTGSDHQSVDIRNLLNERKKVCEEEKRFVQVFIREYWRENEEDYTVIGPRTYFRMPTQIYDPSHLFLPKARELSIGMSNIIHQTLKHEYPMGLNLNWCITPIIAGQTLMDFLAKYFANGVFSKIDEHRKSMVINNSYNSCWKFWDTMKIALQSGIKVRAKHGNRLKYVTVGYVLVDRWHAESGYHTADTYMFECKGKWITATQYYNETYPEHPLQYPFLPMVHVMKPKKEGPPADAANAANAANGTTDGKDKQKADGKDKDKDKQKTDGKEKKENDILIPMELLEVLPVRLENSEMDPEDIKKCLRKAAVSAYERFDKIKVLEDVLRDTLFKRLDEVLGLSVTVKRQVKPIQMTPVKVKTGTDLSYTREFNPRVFSNMAGSGMKRGLKWGLYFVCPNDWVRDSHEASVVNIKKEFLRECARKEIHLDPEPVFTKFIRDDMEEEKNKTDANKEAIRQTVRDVMAEAASSNPDLVLFLSKGKAKPFYQLIKVETELNSDVTWCSQFCIMVEGKKDDKHKWSMAGTSKKFPQMCAKVHSKIQGGLYYDIKFHDCLKDAVVIGADVIHERGHDNPSIAGVVASCRSMGYVNYFSEIRIQESKDQANKTRLREAEEKIVDLYDMLVTLFARIKDTAELKKPKSVFFCRDGVADCQMEVVRDFEGNQIRAAFKEVFGFSIPALNIVVGQKRHKVRFLDNSMEDGNVPPGTLIDDSAIIRGSPTHMDFYLVAHKAIQGTSRPCHYHVIENESKLQPSDYHTVCYQLSHCLPTSAAIISYSAPAAVADRLCERGKIYVNDVFNRPENRRKPPAEKFALAREKLLEFSNAHTQGKVFFS